MNNINSIKKCCEIMSSIYLKMSVRLINNYSHMVPKNIYYQIYT